MDRQTCKEKLKLAREAIRVKDYNEAIRLCQEIFTLDKVNYNGLVFEGAAREGLQQPELALSAYRKAVEIDPSTALAWQGMYKVYEAFPPQNGQDKEELVKVYENMLKITGSNDKKCFEIGVKLAQLYCSEMLYELAVSCCERLMISNEWLKSEGLPVFRVLVAALCHVGNLSEKHLALFKEACEVVIRCKSVEVMERQACVNNLFKAVISQLTEKWRRDPIPLILNCPSSFRKRCCVERVNAADDDVVKSPQLFQITVDFMLVWNICWNAAECNEEDIFILETVHRLYCDGIVDGSNTLDLGSTTSRLSQLCPDNVHLKLIDAYNRFIAGDFAGVRTLLAKDSQLRRSMLTHVLYAKCSIQLRSYQAAVDSVNKAVGLLNGESSYVGDCQRLHQVLNLIHAQALVSTSKSDNWQKAIYLCNDLQDQSTNNSREVLSCKARAAMKLGQYELAHQIINSLMEQVKDSETLNLDGQCKLLQHKFNEAAASFVDSLSLDDSNASSHHCMGLIHWHRLKSSSNDDCGARDECLRHLIQAAKIDPYFGETFLFLGHFYEDIAQDLNKAKRCYQKAFDLDSELSEAGNRLVGCLMALNEPEAALRCLREVIARPNSSKSMKWAWLRLGLYQMKYEDVTDAISSLQVALRLDPSDSHCWECLGEAYMNRGSYNTALKAFTRSLELNPSAVYCSYQLAFIKQKLGQLEEAIGLYTATLLITLDYVPALQGLGVTHSLLASSYASRFLHERAVLHCQMAISNLARAAKLRPELSCVWKSLGDACSIMHIVPEHCTRVKVPTVLLSQNNSADQVEAELNLKEILSLGSKCYAAAIKLRPTMASLWHDLGVNYYYQARVTDKISAADFAEKSLEVLKKSITLNVSNHEHWNALGVVAAFKEIKDYRLAQHCFIKSIQLESRNVCSWTNLGTLYLINDHPELAHEAFKVAQSLDPSYVACWIGQAFIAEKIADQHEALDLFRHTTELGNHPEALIGYAHWVCHTLQDKSRMESPWYQYAFIQMGAIVAASDALAKYLDRVPDDAVAWNMISILLERQKLYRPAANASARCIKLLEVSGGSTETVFLARCNYARLLCASGRYNEAITQYNMAVKDNTIEISCGLALSYYKAGNLQQSSEAYSKALTLADGDDYQQICVAFAMCAYQSEDIEGAKKSLMKCINKAATRPSLDVLKALLCIGLSQRDSDLTSFIIQEFSKSNDAAYCTRSDLVCLLAWSKLLQGDQRDAVSLLVSDVHRYPNMAGSWTQLGQFLLLNFGDQYSCVINQCSQVALIGDATERQGGLRFRTLAQHVSQQLDSSCNAYQSAKKLVHIRPDDVSGWCVLLAASHKESVARRLCDSPNVDLQAFTLQCSMRILKEVESQLTHGEVTGVAKQTLQSLHIWCAQQYTLALVTSGQINQAQQFLQQATWLYENDEMLRALMAVVNRDVQSLNLLTADELPLVFNQLQLAVYLMLGMSNEAQGVYGQWRQECSYSDKNRLLSVIERKLLKLHHKTGNSAGVEELLKNAKKSKNESLLQFYEDLTSTHQAAQ